MIAKWAIGAFLLALLTVGTGCRSSQPNLKPEKTAERLVDPPAGSYMTSTMPKQAFQSVSDPAKYAIDGKSPGVLPTRGGTMMPGGPGGMGAMR